MSPRGRALPLRLLLIGSTLWFCWLAMMLLHECGHVLVARLTGGTVRRVVWHPATLSRTDVSPNPHPLVEVWAGPIVGGLFPLVQMLALDPRRKLPPAWAFVGFCLLCNGAYLGVGTFDPVGDAKQLVTLGTPRWVLLAVGTAMTAGGILVWHGVSPAFGFGHGAPAVSRVDAYVITVLAVLLTVLGFAGDRG